MHACVNSELLMLNIYMPAVCLPSTGHRSLRQRLKSLCSPKQVKTANSWLLHSTGMVYCFFCIHISQFTSNQCRAFTIILILCRVRTRNALSAGKLCMPCDAVFEPMSTTEKRCVHFMRVRCVWLWFKSFLSAYVRHWLFLFHIKMFLLYFLPLIQLRSLLSRLCICGLLLSHVLLLDLVSRIRNEFSKIRDSVQRSDDDTTDADSIRAGQWGIKWSLQRRRIFL